MTALRPLWLAAIVAVPVFGNTACGRIGVEVYEIDADAHVPPDAGVLNAEEADADAAIEEPEDGSAVDIDTGTESPTDAALPADAATDIDASGLPVDAGGTPMDAAPPTDASLSDAAASDASTPLPSVASTIACGEAHSCGVFASRLYCWGDNTTSALGSAPPTSSTTPRAVTTAIADWEQVEAGWGSSCARTRSGDVWCWGQNNMGQLGVGDTTTRTTPVQVPLPAAARSISAGFSAACALLTDASLWCWGDNYEGQMGQSDTFPGTSEPDPIQVPGSWSSMTVGQGHHCATRSPGELWCMGRNSEDELGQGPSAPIQLRAPTRVGTASDWTQVSGGQQYTCGVRAGSLWCWGDNNGGMLGVGDQTARDVPTRVGTGTDWLAVRGHTFHTCGLRAPGTLWCWGRNVEGQLGLGDTTRRLAPVQVGTATDWVEVALGIFHTCARRSDGSLWCAGENLQGRLGTGDQTRRNSLTQVMAP